jgi:hypothetical protein
MNNPWQPVQIETKDVIALSEGTVHLIFDLSAVADADWSHLFLTSPVRKTGSLTYVSETYPGVESKRIICDVPDQDLEDAVRYVQASIDHANSQYESDVLPRRARAQRDALSAEQAEQTRLAELKRRLGQT